MTVYLPYKNKLSKLKIFQTQRYAEKIFAKFQKIWIWENLNKFSIVPQRL